MVKKTVKKIKSHSKKTIANSKKIAQAKSVKATSSAKSHSERASKTLARNNKKAVGLSARTKKKKSSKANSEKLNAYNYAGQRQSRKIQHRKNKAEYLATLPKSRGKRLLYRLHPKRFFSFWFSKRGFILGLKLAGLSVIAGFVLLIGLFAWFRQDLPDPDDLSTRTLVETTEFFDRTGEIKLFEVFGDERRKVVPFEDISQFVKDATIAIEDESFFEHNGFSFEGIARAALNNATAGEDGGLQGGSTITQQFVKNSLLSNEQTVTRKLKELILSVELERRYSKDEILGFYLNEISYGGISFGVQAASEIYFDKNASELTLDEAAVLAALPQAPGNFNPYGDNTEGLINRRDVVLEKMVELGYIDRETADVALETDTLAKLVPIEEQNAYNEVVAPHFVEKVREILIEDYGTELVENGGLKVITTLDVELQELAEAAVEENIDAGVANGGDNAALSSTDVDTGQVLAQVGSRDFFFPGYGSVNAASPELGRQPGSSFKPFGYAELFKSGDWGPGSIIWDTDTTFLGNYSPDNFDFLFPGAMTIREALGRSRNIPAVKALYLAGVENTVDLARSFGNEFLCDDCYDDSTLSIILGAGEVKLDEHTHAYSTFARGGVSKPQAYILKVENSRDEVLFEWEDTPGEEVLDPQIAYLITDILTDDNARRATFGANNANLVVPGLNQAVKTGTTDQSVDGWLLGYTTCTATGVWVGNHDGRPMNSITSRQTGPIFTQFTREAEALRGCAEAEFERPTGIKEETLNRNTGRIATSQTTNRVTDLFPSFYEAAPQGDLQRLTLDRVTNRLATECTPANARVVVTESGVLPELPENDPEFGAWARSAPYGSGGGAITAEDNLHDCDDVLPTVSITASQNGNGNANSTSFNLQASVQGGTHDLSSVKFFVDGQEIQSRNIGGSGTFTTNHTFGQGGSFTVTALVEDVALYQDQNSISITVAGGAPPTPTPTPATVPVSVTLQSPASGSTTTTGQVSVSWASTGSIDGFNICSNIVGGVATCSTTSGNVSSGTINIAPAGNYEVFVQALDANGSIIDTSVVALVTVQ